MARPKAIGDLVSELLARRGYAREISGARCGAAWQAAAGKLLARYSRAGQIRRGVLEVIVGNSTVLQELTFQKLQLVARLQELLPDESVSDLRFRVGPVESP